MKQYQELQPQACPICEKEIINYMHLLVKPGQLTICPHCVSMLYLDEKLQLQKLTTGLFNQLHPAIQIELNRLVKFIINKHHEKNTKESGQESSTGKETD